MSRMYIEERADIAHLRKHTRYGTTMSRRTNHPSADREWRQGHIVQLRTGINLLVSAPGSSDGWGPMGFAGPYTPEQEAEMSRCWNQHGERIMKDYRDNRPGQRPWYWWRQRGMALPEDERSELYRLGQLSEEDVDVVD